MYSTILFYKILMKAIMKPVAVVLVLFFAPPAFACVMCDSARAQYVRSQVLGEDFYTNLGIVLLPMIILLGIVGVIYHVDLKLFNSAKIENNHE